MKKTIIIWLLLMALSPAAHAIENISIGVELGYGVRELESPNLRDAESAVGTASLKLAVGTMEGLSAFLALGIAEVNVEYIELIEKVEVIGEHGEVVKFGFRWCAPITDMGIPQVKDMRVGISYEYLIIMSDIDREIRGNVAKLLHPDSEIEIKKHEFSLFISKWLDFLTLYAGVRYSDIMDMEIEIPNEPTVDFTAKEEIGIVIGADIPLGNLLLNLEVEALHEASLRLGGSIAF